MRIRTGCWLVGMLLAASWLAPTTQATETEVRLGLGPAHHWHEDAHGIGARLDGALLLDESWAWLLDVGYSGALRDGVGSRIDVLTRVEYRLDVVAWVPSVRLGGGMALWTGGERVRVEPSIQLGWAVTYRPHRQWGIQLWNDCVFFPAADAWFGVSSGLAVQWFL